jgi:hypothetical protein
VQADGVAHHCGYDCPLRKGDNCRVDGGSCGSFCHIEGDAKATALAKEAEEAPAREAAAEKAARAEQGKCFRCPYLSWTGSRQACSASSCQKGADGRFPATGKNAGWQKDYDMPLFGGALLPSEPSAPSPAPAPEPEDRWGNPLSSYDPDDSDKPAAVRRLHKAARQQTPAPAVKSEGGLDLSALQNAGVRIRRKGGR